MARLREQESREVRIARAVAGGRGGDPGVGAAPVSAAAARTPSAAATAASGHAKPAGGGLFGFGRKPKPAAVKAFKDEAPAARAVAGAPAAAPVLLANEVAPEDEADVSPATDATMMTMRL